MIIPDPIPTVLPVISNYSAAKEKRIIYFSQCSLFSRIVRAYQLQFNADDKFSCNHLASCLPTEDIDSSTYCGNLCMNACGAPTLRIYRRLVFERRMKLK